MISLTLWKILFIYLLMTPPSAVTSLILQTGRLQPLPSFQPLKKNITKWSNTWNMSFNHDKSHILTISLQKDHLANPIYFLNNPLEEVQSPKLLGLTIGRDLIVCWWRP